MKVLNWIPSPMFLMVLGLLGASILLVPTRRLELDGRPDPSLTIEAPLVNTVVAVAALEKGSRLSEADIRIIGDRPLFRESRRPMPAQSEITLAPAADEPAPPAEQSSDLVIIPEATIAPPNIQLFGTYQIDGRTAALLKSDDMNEEKWSFPGDLIDGWTLKRIIDDGVELSKGDSVYTIGTSR